MNSGHPADTAWRLGSPVREAGVVGAFFLALTLALFAPVLFGPGDRLLGVEGNDLERQFIHWRALGFGEMAKGHLLLWNPHIYGGTQYLGGFQSALLYPPNWLCLCLPLPRAVNLGIALHVFLAGWYMYFWVRFRGLHVIAAALAGVLCMLGGPYFLHVYAGHLPNLCTMVWAPLVLLAIDGWFARRTAGWLLFGGAVVAMQILAGHPQYVFYTGVAAALYGATKLWRDPQRGRMALGLVLIPVLGAALSAVQLFEGLHASAESLRGRGTTPEFAGSFSFPPENLLTALSPGLFGNLTAQPYWGRGFLWEMCPFVGVGGLVLAIYALFAARRRETWVCVGLGATLFALALGHYTPLFDLLYQYAPGFNKFRGWSKFIHLASLFVVMLAATGFDALFQREKGAPRALVGGVLGGAALLAGAAAWAAWSAGNAAADGPEPWRGWIYAALYSGESVNTWAADDFLRPENVRAAALFASRALFLAAGALLAFALAFGLSRRWRHALWAVPAVALAEMHIFAVPTLVTFPYDPARRSEVGRFLAAHPTGDDRLLDPAGPNIGMSTGENDLWGYDPGVTRRYGAFMTSTQNGAPDEATQELRFQAVPDLYATLLRCRFVFRRDEPGQNVVRSFDDSLVAPHVMLVPRVRVVPAEDDLLRAMAPPFDPREEVLLQTVPEPAPTDNPTGGKASVVAQTTDTLTIEADLPAAEVLVVTDAYSDGWQARSVLPPGKSAPQARYQVLPADECVRAIPLAAGHHRILLEYRPAAFVAGEWASGVSVAGCMVAAGWLRRRGRWTALTFA